MPLVRLRAMPLVLLSVTLRTFKVPRLLPVTAVPPELLMVTPSTSLFMAVVSVVTALAMVGLVPPTEGTIAGEIGGKAENVTPAKLASVPTAPWPIRFCPFNKTKLPE